MPPSSRHRSNPRRRHRPPPAQTPTSSTPTRSSPTHRRTTRSNSRSRSHVSTPPTQHTPSLPSSQSHAANSFFANRGEDFELLQQLKDDLDDIERRTNRIRQTLESNSGRRVARRGGRAPSNATRYHGGSHNLQQQGQQPQQAHRNHQMMGVGHGQILWSHTNPLPHHAEDDAIVGGLLAPRDPLELVPMAEGGGHQADLFRQSIPDL